MLRRALLTAPLAVMVGAGPAMAQVGSTAAPAKHLSPEDAAAFSKQVERDLAARGARLAIVFRSGRARKDLPEGLNYTHGAFWAYQPARTEDGEIRQGYAVYNLYQGDGKAMRRDRSYLAQDFPFDFVSGSVLDYVAVIIPTPEMQRRILAVMASPTYQRMHNPSYSLIANPFNPKHQNCNDFMLQIIAAAAWQTEDPAQLRLNLAAHFKPSVIKAGPLQKLFGPAIDDGLKLDDQNVRRIITATYESIAPFMASNGLLQETYVIRRVVA
jgi:hypothetical protein